MNEMIGFIFQSCNLLPDLDVFDNCALPLHYRRFDSLERRRRIDRALGLVGISSLARRLPSELSDGQKRCVSIARAIAGSPRLVLADEPTANLDTASTHHVLQVLKEINISGATIIVVSHNTCLPAPRYVFCYGLVSTEFASPFGAEHLLAVPSWTLPSVATRGRREGITLNTCLRWSSAESRSRARVEWLHPRLWRCKRLRPHIRRIAWDSHACSASQMPLKSCSA